MTRSQRLDPLLRVKQQRQDDVAREVAERDRTLAEQRVQRELDDLGARRVRNGAGGGDGEVPA